MPHPDPLLHKLHDWISLCMRLSMRGSIRYMKENGLSISQVGAMGEIIRGSNNVSDVGDALGISIAAASQLLERLVQMGFVTRTEDPQDRRVKKLVVTEKGRRVRRESTEVRQGWLTEMVAGLSPAEKQQVSDAVDILLARAMQLDRAPEPERQ